MRHAIEIDDEVLAELGRRARPFIDVEPNAVLRRLLALDDGDAAASPSASATSEPRPLIAAETVAPRRKATARKTRKRAARGSLLDERAYELPILQTLVEHGGRAPAADIIQRVGELVDDQLTALDREPLETGGIRWQKRVQFARLRMKEQRLLDRDAPRGVWAITDLGRARLGETTATAA